MKAKKGQVNEELMVIKLFRNNYTRFNVSETFQANVSSPLKVVKHFGADCSGSIGTSGEGRECNVTNEFVQKEYISIFAKMGIP
jgi:hypothetical protein